MRVAVVGAGSMGSLHAELLAGIDEVDEVLVVEADPNRADAVAAATGARVATFDGAIEAADALVVATPPSLHAAAVEAALAAGRHVLCEKPLTDALDSTIELTRRIEAEGAHVEIGFQRRHDAGFVAAREAVAGGRIHHLTLTAHDPALGPLPEPVGPAPEVAPAYRDSSIHDFDLARWLTGQEVTEVTAVAARRDGSRPVDPRGIESSVVSMRLSGGTLATLASSWLHPHGYDIRAEVVGERAAVTAGLSPRTPVAHADWTPRPADGWAGYLERFRPAYRAELVDFLACCRGVRPPAATARDGLEAMRVAVAATRSAMEGRAVRLDEIPGLARREVA